MKDYKRRSFFIDRKYQGRVIMNLIIICSVGLLLELGLFNYLSYRSIETMRWKTHISADTVGDITRSYLVYTSLFSLLFTIAALYVYLKFVHQRSAGPLYRLNRDIETATAGDLSFNIWLRREDDFKETAHELNLMLASVRNDFRLLSDGIADAGRTIDVLEYVENKPEVARRKCDELLDRLEPLKYVRS